MLVVFPGLKGNLEDTDLAEIERTHMPSTQGVFVKVREWGRRGLA